LPRFQFQLDFYGISQAGSRKLDYDLEALRCDHDIIHENSGRYALAQNELTKSVLDSILTAEERQVLRRLEQEITPEHPFGMDLQLLLDKLARQLNRQNERLASSAPQSQLGTRFTRDYRIYRPLLEDLEKAINRHTRISFVYQQPTSRDISAVPHVEVESQFLELRNGSFYLYGYNLYKQHGYHFRVDKIRDFKPLGDTFGAFRNPEKEMVEIEYIVHAKIVKGGISERFYRQEVIERLPDGSAHLRALDFEFWLMQELLRMGQTVRLVAAPSSLKDKYFAEIKGMYSQYFDEVI
jgi:predicted DNA-binding transcriptional regulator YafY